MNDVRTDRITPETKIVGGLVIVVLLLAFLALYVQPDHTDVNFAWTILPRTSAIFMGAGYTAGAYFFARVLIEKQWHRVQAGFLAITGFTICMLAATLLHLSRFHQGALSFYLWTIIYIITPFVVPFLWWRNRGTASSDLEARDLRFSRPVRLILGGGAVLGVLAFVVIFIRPSILIGLAPWKLTELTARVFAGWTILALLSVLTIAMDGRWSAARYLVQSAMVALVLVLLALPRTWADFDPVNPLTFVLVGAIVVTLAAFLVLHFRMDSAAGKHAASAA